MKDKLKRIIININKSINKKPEYENISEIKDYLTNPDIDFVKKFEIIDLIVQFNVNTQNKTAFNIQSELMECCSNKLLIAYFTKYKYKGLIKNELYLEVFNDYLPNERKYQITKGLILKINQNYKDNDNDKEFIFFLYEKTLCYLLKLRLNIKEYKEILNLINIDFYNWLIDKYLSKPLLINNNDTIKIISSILNLYDKEDLLYKAIIDKLMELNIIGEKIEINNEDLEKIINYLKVFSYNTKLLQSISKKITNVYIFNDKVKNNYYLFSNSYPIKYLRIIRLTLLRIEDVNKPQYKKVYYNIDTEKEVKNKLTDFFVVEFIKAFKDKLLFDRVHSKDNKTALLAIKKYYEQWSHKYDFIVLKRFEEIINDINKKKDNYKVLLTILNSFNRNNFASELLINSISEINNEIVVEFINKGLKSGKFNEHNVHKQFIYDLKDEKDKVLILKEINFKKYIEILKNTSNLKLKEKNILLKSINKDALTKELSLTIINNLEKGNLKDLECLNFIFSDCYNEDIQEIKRYILENTKEGMILLKLILLSNYFYYNNGIGFKYFELDEIFISLYKIYLNDEEIIVNIKDIFKYDNIEKLPDIFAFINEYFNQFKQDKLKFKVNNNIVSFKDMYFICSFLSFNKEKILIELDKI